MFSTLDVGRRFGHGRVTRQIDCLSTFNRGTVGCGDREGCPGPCECVCDMGGGGDDDDSDDEESASNVEDGGGSSEKAPDAASKRGRLSAMFPARGPAVRASG